MEQAFSTAGGLPETSTSLPKLREAESAERESRKSTQPPASRSGSRWDIDVLLEGVIGQSIRVAADAFVIVGPNGEGGQLIQTDDLILPDNTRPNGLPVFFEGVLFEITRRIGIVHVQLGEPLNSHASAEGCVPFRGGLAVILRGPAVVRLAVPFLIEKLPQSERNYWRDLHLPQAQFLLPLENEI